MYPEHPVASPRRAQNGPSWTVPALLAVLAAVVYAPSLRFGFVYDDRVQILSNPWLKSWRFVPQYFTQHASAFDGVAMGGFFWRPLFLLWLKLNYSLFGFQPLGWHITTVLLHALVTAMVYLLAQRLLRDRMAAAFAALLFGIYPATIETAAWIAGATDSLMAVFLLPSFLLFLRGREQGRRRALAVSLLAYAFGLMVKESAIILPALIFAYAWLYAEEASSLARVRAALAAVAPYAAVTLLYLVPRTYALRAPLYPPYPNTISDMVLTWPGLLLFYLRLLVFPAPVSPHYNLHVLRQFSVTGVLLPALALPAIAAAAYLLGQKLSPQLAREHRRAAMFGLIWILLTVAPVLYLRPMPRDDFAHLRYLYLPVMGYGIVLALLLSCIPRGKTSPLFGRAATQVMPALALIALCALGTSRAQLPWADNFSLFSHAARVAPENSRALTDLAIELGSRQRFAEALDLFHKALQLNPDLWYANLDLGYTYFLMGRYPEAEMYVKRAVGLAPYAPGGYGVLATIELKLGNVDQAIQALQQGIEHAPRDPTYHYALALIFERQGRTSEAAKSLAAVLAIDPSYADARSRLAAITHSPRPTTR